VVRVDAVESYEAWISESAGSIHVKVVPLVAKTERAAFREAQSLCTGTEFVRGIVTVYPEGE
jgi:hypothetical protein